MNIQSDINKRLLELDVTNRQSAATYIAASLSEEGVKNSFDLAHAFTRNGKITTKSQCKKKINSYLKK